MGRRQTVGNYIEQCCQIIAEISMEIQYGLISVNVTHIQQTLLTATSAAAKAALKQCGVCTWHVIMRLFKR